MFDDNSVVVSGESRKMEVIARSGLRMREGAGTDFDVVGSLAAGAVITERGKEGVWIKVDVEGDGMVDGYCHGSYLRPV